MGSEGKMQMMPMCQQMMKEHKAMMQMMMNMMQMQKMMMKGVKPCREKRNDDGNGQDA